MGTLTGDCPILAEHCAHKLATSCRLSATSKCCACQDKRQHSATYSVYVDGVGMVSRGTRWQRYCWFCKEFWQNRIAASDPPIDPKDTRVPNQPDQTDFLRQWFEYKRGYRILHTDDDGNEHRQEMVKELPWAEVAPGCLPLRSTAVSRSSGNRRPARQQQAQSNTIVTIDSTIDELLEDADREQRPQSRSNTGSANAPSQRTTRTFAGHTNLSEADREYISRRLVEVEQRRRSLTSELAEVRREARRLREQENQSLRAQQTARNMERVFGSREEMQNQGAEYVSPLANMFTRAYDRYNIAEEVRAQERISLVTAESQMTQAIRFLREVFPSEPHSANPPHEEHSLPPMSLDDERIERSPPKSEAEMTTSLACRVCLQQISDTAILPCGHLIMCSFCAAIVIPVNDENHMRPMNRSAKCLLCRKPVTRLTRIYTS